MANKVPPEASSKLRKQQRIIQAYKKEEHWLKWAIIVAIALILLLLLLAGWATDWTRGLKKNSKPGLSSLEQASPLDANGQRSSTESVTNDQASERSTSTTSTSTHSETTNNTTSKTPNGALLQLYEDIGVGDDIGAVMTLANQLGISVTCSDGLLSQLIQECVFSRDGQTITTRSILGSGLVTSVTNNF